MNEYQQNYFLLCISKDIAAIEEEMLEVADGVIRANIQEQDARINGGKIEHSEISPAALTQWSAGLCAIQQNLMAMMMPAQEQVNSADAETMGGE